jgi:transcriptional regulator with XRE-family HTH domain
MKKTFGSVVADARRKKNLSQKDLAAEITMRGGKQGMSAAYLNDIEHDRRKPSTEHTISSLASVLDLDVDYLQMLASGKLPEDLVREATGVDPGTYSDALRVFRDALRERKT